MICTMQVRSTLRIYLFPEIFEVGCMLSNRMLFLGEWFMLLRSDVSCEIRKTFWYLTSDLGSDFLLFTISWKTRDRTFETSDLRVDIKSFVSTLKSFVSTLTSEDIICVQMMSHISSLILDKTSDLKRRATAGAVWDETSDLTMGWLRWVGSFKL